MTAWLVAAMLCAAPQGAPHKFALVMGENEGDPSDQNLRFAEADARRVAETLADVGGVQPEDLTLLLSADADRLSAALSSLAGRLRERARPGDQLIVYVSAHADDRVLHLRGTHFPLTALREAVLAAPVDVALLVLDTCQSGSLTRVKGLRRVSGVAVNIQTAELKGRVIVTSSGPDEYAQESEQLGGSYFTYHWTNGLRGPADTSRDGRVTLQEAYDYAYARTVESTFANPAGVQHPNFLVDLKGQGDLVLSETTDATTRLLIAVKEPGEWLILSDEGGTLLSSFQKRRGPVNFAIAPGSYRVRLRVSDGFKEARVAVGGGTFAVIRDGDLTTYVGDTVALKGSDRWTLGVAASSGPPLVGAASWLVGGELSVVKRTRPLGPFDLVLAVARFRASAPSAGSILENETDLRLGVGTLASRDRWTLLAAVEVGALGVYQSRIPNGPRFGVEGMLGGRGQLSVRLQSLAPFLFVDGGGVVMRTDAGRALGWTLALGLGVQFPLSL